MNVARTLSLLISLYVTCGCYTHREEVANGSKYKTDYAQGQMFKTLVPLFIDEFGLKREGGIQGGPYTLAEYQMGDQRKWPRVRGITPAGTDLLVKRIVVERNFEIGTMNYIYVQIRSGPFSNL